MIIGVDHGYSAMKTAHICFPSGIVRYEHEPYTNRGVLRIEGKYYVCGTGRQPLLRTCRLDFTAADVRIMASETGYAGR